MFWHGDMLACLCCDEHNALTNPFVSEAPASPTALRPVVRLLVVCRQVEVRVAVLQLEKETRLPSLSVCCDSHCNRTSR